jgi:hypothetical protein
MALAKHCEEPCCFMLETACGKHVARVRQQGRLAAWARWTDTKQARPSNFTCAFLVRPFEQSIRLKKAHTPAQQSAPTRHLARGRFQRFQAERLRARRAR